jgi:hypothetical protein
MKKLFLFLIGGSALYAQTNPAITQWMQNTTNIMGRHYVSGNPTPIADNVLANVQSVKYSANSVYVTTHGIPAYITGPFLDGNPSLATDQNAIYKLPLNPVQNSGTPTATTGGNIGIFINGVSLFDYRDGVAWNNTTQALCGGPGNPPCPGGPTATQAWNRDAIPAEKGGFDCNKAHPAMGNYHHHQNPSAFNLDLQVISTICNTYPADGLYVINTNTHSPLIGFAYDGFPIYGAYAYTNTDGSGGISRMKSSYQLKNQTTRTNGPAVNATYYNGYFREDYEYVSHPNDPSYLDEHNGRFCITPEYPNGIYCYFATVDANHNSAYPYIVGPTFYGVKSGIKVTSITEATTTYTAPLSLNENTASNFNLIIAPNPAQDFIAIQTEITNENFEVILVDELGKTVKSGQLLQGSTLCILETDGLYNGVYFVKVRSSSLEKAFKVIIEK